MNKKTYFTLLILTIVASIVITYFHKQKKLETNHSNITNTISQNILNNANLENQIKSNIIIPSQESNTLSKNVVYEFTSADSFASQGNPGILKIFDLTNSKIEFEYNHGWNFAQSTIDRKISGIAKLNTENLYEFSENVDGYNYTITIKFSEEMITLSEYIDRNLISIINLWS